MSRANAAARSRACVVGETVEPGLAARGRLHREQDDVRRIAVIASILSGPDVAAIARPSSLPRHTGAWRRADEAERRARTR